MALAQFVNRVDFETVARFAAVTVVCDGKSEADLIWLALIALRLAEASVAPRYGSDMLVSLAACWSRFLAKAKIAPHDRIGPSRPDAIPDSGTARSRGEKK